MAFATATAASLLLASFAAPLRAEDTDIFTVNKAVTSERPNVLIVQDNSANWNSVFAAEKSALVSTVSGLDDRFNVGLMTFVETGGGNTSVDGSYVRAAVRQMTTANKTALANLVNSFDQLADKSNNAVYGLTMAEIYRYFGGLNATTGQVKRDAAGNTFNSGASGPASQAVYALPGNAFTSMASNTYVSPIADNCAKNFVIFISNGPGQDNASATSTATSALSGYGGNTSSITLSPNGSQSNIADEWARFLANTDVNAAHALTQNVVSYTVDVNPGTTGQGPGWTALLKSIALQGKGKYFAVNGNTTEIADALNQIFQEVIAQNSVFAASALPASVNTRGTFLNQVYMGQFRPDGNASPRWTGNLKQYTAGLNTATPPQLELQDSLNKPIADTTFGFINGTVKSFWTTDSTFWDAAYYPAAQAPVNNITGLPIAGTSDNPDGNLVEKGGAAQRLRIAYAGPSPNLVSTRNVYTCTGTCAAGSSLSGFPFDTSNAAIDATALGINIVASVSSMTYTETTPGVGTVTATASAHGFTTGQSVTMSGASQTEYNGLKTVTVVDANTFTYLITVNPTTPATGTITLTKPTITLGTTSVTRSAGTGLTATASVTTLLPHLYATGDSIVIAGATGTSANYNKTATVTVTGANTFTYSINVDPPSPGATSGVAGGSSINTITRSGTTVTVTTQNGSFTNGSSVAISGVPTAAGGAYYNTTVTLTAGGTKTFSFTTAIITPTTAAGPITATKPTSAVTVSSITRAGPTAYVTTATAHGVSAGQTFTIAGANESNYDGSFSAVSGSGSTLTYTVTVSPASPASGTIVATLTGTANKDELIRWVRGENRQLDDNPSTAGAANTYVRGYLHGDVVHSRPAIVNYNRNGDDNDVVVFYGANDGIFHAAQGGRGSAGGNELWGFIPSEFFKKFTRLYSEQPLIDNANSATAKSYFMDGPIATYTLDVNNDGKLKSADGDKVYLYMSARRGGRFIYALDVSDPATPKMLWSVNSSTAGFAELGQTWGEGKVTKLRGYTNPVLVLTAGYDATANDAATQGTATMGRGVFMIDAITGAPIWHAGKTAVTSPPSGMTSVAVTGMDYAIPADAAVIDSDADGYADRLYLADTGGNIWRANISALTSGGVPDKAAWTVDKLASLGGTGSDARKFLFVPDVVAFDGPPTTIDSILIGSGDREHPFDVSIQNRFYMIKDSHALTARPATGVVIHESDLFDATNDAIQVGTTVQQTAAALALASASGWFVTLGTGEKVVTPSVTLAGSTIFGTNLPESTVSTATSCSSGLGEARIYTVGFKDATSKIDQPVDGVLGANDRYSTVPGGGLPPPPVAISVEINGKFYEGVGMGPTIITPPGPSIAGRKRVYWNMLSESR